MASMLSAIITLSEAAAEHEGSTHLPYFVGGGVLSLLLLALLALVAFGGGRDHA